jgi:uncharacterized protein YggU (UPF0235/DUF167 family)
MSVTVIQVKVRPSSGASSLEQKEDGTWFARLKAAPEDGKANAELLTLVAKHFKVPRSAVSIMRGASGRTKLLSIDRRAGSDDA